MQGMLDGVKPGHFHRTAHLNKIVRDDWSKVLNSQLLIGQRTLMFKSAERVYEGQITSTYVYKSIFKMKKSGRPKVHKISNGMLS